MSASSSTAPRGLSQKQIDAARRIDQDVCVVAGPGSGKTSVLIERFAWLVTEQSISPHRILAITFTEKAATEIKSRMMARFEDNPALRQEIERAYVSTVHAFCARLLRENSIAAAIDPQFEVLDWAQSNALLRTVTDEALEAIYAAQPERMRGFLRSLAVATERDGFVPDLAQSLMEIYGSMRIAGVPIDNARLAAPEFGSDLRRFHKLLNDIAADRPRANTTNQQQTHAALRDWALEMLALDGVVTREHFRLLQVKCNKSGLVKGSTSRESLDEVRALSERLHARLLIEYYSAERDLILTALQQIDSLYRDRKRAGSALDFDDLEEQAIHLLSSDGTLQRKVRMQFDFILMDELQDTNPLQWRLLSLIRRDNNFFAVGDVNQSIFGFRHAEPELFLNYRRQLEQRGLEIDELRDNYRSRAAVLDAVNTTFHNAPGIETHSLVPRREFPVKQQPSVEAIAVLSESTPEAERMEAQWVARRITELAGRLELGDGKLASYRDIAILTRSNIATAALQTALDDHGIPSLVLGGLTLFDTREIQDLVLLLSVLVNPRNEIALAGLLRSPFFGVSDEDLLRLRRDGRLHEAVVKTPPAGWDMVASLREIRNMVSPDRLLRRALDVTGYEIGLSSRAQANIEKVLAALRSRFGNKPAPLAQILSELETAAPDSEAPPSDFGDAVRLMTIHKSKGLEFPVVFLPFLHTGRGTGFPIVSYSHAYGLGVKWRDPHTRAGEGDSIFHANKAHIEALQAAEDNRVLYVAMTRAKEHMVLSFSVTKHTRGKWAEFLKDRLSLAGSSALNEPVERNAAGIRVLTVDKPPVRARAAGQGAGASREIILLEPPARTGQQDATASVTDISVYSQCPRRYYLGRYLRWRAPASSIFEEPEYPGVDNGEWDGPGTGAAELGTQVHALLAGQPVPGADPQALALAARFRASVLGQQAAKSSCKQHEYDFVFALDDLVLRGQIDLFYEHGRDLILIDYKTDRVSAPISTERLRPYELQLQIYALAIERALKRLPSRAYLYFLRPDVPVEVDLTPLALNAARERVREFLAAQSAVDFPLREAEHCHRCDFLGNLCPATVASLAASETAELPG